jgi:hypothetical protein
LKTAYGEHASSSKDKTSRHLNHEFCFDSERGMKTLGHSGSSLFQIAENITSRLPSAEEGNALTSHEYLSEKYENQENPPRIEQRAPVRSGRRNKVDHALEGVGQIGAYSPKNWSKT